LDQVEEAKRICGACSARRQCLAWALEPGAVSGVWGGSTEDERLAMRKAAAIPPRTAAPLIASKTNRRVEAGHDHMDKSVTPGCYEIRLRGLLGETLLGAFPDLHAQADGTETVLTGALPDQAALHGVLAQIEAFGLELLELRRTSC
jgi:hypothetical protein